MRPESPPPPAASRSQFSRSSPASTDGWVDAVYASAQSSASAADSDLIASAADALSVLDFEPVAKAKLAAVALGVAVDRWRRRRDHEQRIAKGSIAIRFARGGWWTSARSTRQSGCSARRGRRRSIMSPVGGHRTYNPEGELATARAAKAKKHLQVLSTVTTTLGRRGERGARRAGVVPAVSARRLGADAESCSSAWSRPDVRRSCSRSICSVAGTWSSSIACCSAIDSSVWRVT